MFKLVACFAVLAVAAAQVAPLAYNAGAWPYNAGVLPYTAGAWPYSAGYSTYPYNAGVLPYAAGAFPYNSAYTYPYNYGVGSTVPLDTPEVAAAKVSHFQAKALVESGVYAVPMDTPEVAAAKASHLKAKALVEESHSIKKRSVVAPVVAPVAYSTYGAYPYATPYAYNGYSAYPYSAAAVTPYSAYPAGLGYRGLAYRGAFPYHY